MKFGEMVNLSVKWPNDIFLAGKKVGGVLLETCFTGNVPKRAVFGVGINVSTAPDLSSGTAYGISRWFNLEKPARRAGFLFAFESSRVILMARRDSLQRGAA